MTREKIGEVYTDENGKARMSLNISDIPQDFTIEAVYDQFDDSTDFSNITYTLTLDAEETIIDTSYRLELSGELTGDDGTLIDDETIYIYANNQKIKTVTVINGSYETLIDNLNYGEYTIYAGWRNDRVVSNNINISVGEPILTLTAEKQYINVNEESNSLILTGFYRLGSVSMAGKEIKIYDGSTLIDTKITDADGGFEVPLSNITNGMHLYKATYGEIESEIFEVYIGIGSEVVIETTSNSITFGYSEVYPWLSTRNRAVTIYFGDGATQAVTDPVSKLTHTFNDNKQKHMIVLDSPNQENYGLGYDFLRENTGVTNIIIGSSPYRIDDKAFYGCTGLESIHIPYNIEEIGESAFEGCTRLQTVTIEEETHTIGNKAFYGCTSINEYKLLWNEPYTIVPYDSNKFQTNLLTKFVVRSGQKNNFITKGYPADRIEGGKVELTIVADKQEYNMDEDVIVTITLKENGSPIAYENIGIIFHNIIAGSPYSTIRRTNSNGQIIQSLNNLILSPPLTCGGDIDIIATYGDVTNVLNIDGYIYKNSLQEEDVGKWILKGNSIISYNENGLELLGMGYGAFILNKKLFKYYDYFHSSPITIEYDYIYGYDSYSYLNYFFDENLEDKIFQLAKKIYGVKGTILDEYPNSDNWINTIIQNNDHVKIKINSGNVELYINEDLILTKNNYDMINFKNKLFAFATDGISYAVYKNLKIAYEQNYNITLSADETSIGSGETATITASIGAANKKLHYQVKNGSTLMYEGDVITDNNGEASITYIGTGVGDVDIIFTYFDIEEEISIEDGAGKIQTIITLTSPTEGELFNSDESIDIEGVLVDKNGNPLANKQIKIENNEVE